MQASQALYPNRSQTQMEAIMRIKNLFKRHRPTVERTIVPAADRPLLPGHDFDPMSSRTFVTHFDLSRLL